MARTIEFNPASARDNALVLFWRKGYQATSLADLLEAMAISRSSFYATFVDKRSLFLACLDLFAQRTIGMLAQARAELPPLEALQTFYARNFVGARGNRSRWGCMLVNTALEMADVD
ncbi:MAG: TetR/AcrR family transcriptional regulator, partial [Rhodanobacter sp.]